MITLHCNFLVLLSMVFLKHLLFETSYQLEIVKVYNNNCPPSLSDYCQGNKEFIIYAELTELLHAQCVISTQCVLKCVHTCNMCYIWCHDMCDVFNIIIRCYDVTILCVYKVLMWCVIKQCVLCCVLWCNNFVNTPWIICNPRKVRLTLDTSHFKHSSYSSLVCFT